VIRGIISIFLLTLVSSVTIAFLLGSSPTFFHAAIASSFTTQKGPASSTSVFKITDEIKDRINALVDSNRTNAAIVIGIVDANGTQFYSNGKISNTNNTTVDQNTIFAIGSNTKVFTTILLAEMVEDGLIKLNDPIDKYLPPNVTIPQYKGHKITIEDLATHTSGLPEFPSIIVPASQFQMRNPLMIKFNACEI
jgi:CubicO group peptidase (beta-lactamase class C family)